MLHMKLSSTMQLQWAKKFIDFSSNKGRVALQNEDGAIFLLKTSYVSSKKYFSVMRLSEEGLIEWEVEIGSSAGNGYAKGMALT